MELTPDIILRRRGRSAKLKGDAVERLVASRLRSMGYLMVARIQTGWRVRRAPGGKIISASPIGKVAADFTAVESGTGRAVVCECKYRPRVLCFSDLEHHQVECLSGYQATGALALLAWLSDTGLSVMRWPIPGFAPGKSLQPSLACALDVAKEAV